MTLYKRFRGQEPTIDALLKRDGITYTQPDDATLTDVEGK